MKDFSTLQLLVGTISVMFLLVSATFAGYWNIIGKKNRSLPKQKTARSAGLGESFVKNQAQN
jgi:hypothetical protein